MVTPKQVSTPDGIRMVWADAHNNYWDSETHSREVADALSKTLRACSYCYNCYDCTGCVACVRCWHCIGCQVCSQCASCVSCIGCNNCADYCGWCEDCDNCVSVISGKRLVGVAPRTQTENHVFVIPNARGRYVLV